MFQHGLTNAGHDAAMALAMHQHRVDRHAHIIHRRVIGDGDFASCWINFYLGNVAAIGEIAFRIARVGQLFVKPGSFPRWQARRVMRSGDHRGPACGDIRPRDAETAIEEFNICHTRFQQMRGDALGLFNDKHRSTAGGNPAHLRRSRSSGATALQHNI